MKKNRNAKCFAFTLAEVLITLVIIGVIAAITVPSLINKTNNQETVSRLKKAYSTMSQATNMIIAENGPATSWVTTKDEVFNLYKKKLINVIPLVLCYRDCYHKKRAIPVELMMAVKN